MSPKKLQADSKYAMADADGDGIITDDEMDRHERWIRLENEDKMMDTQRTICILYNSDASDERTSLNTGGSPHHSKTTTYH